MTEENTPAPEAPRPQLAAVPSAPSPQERARACYAELVEVLAKHGCSIAPILRPLEPIGHAGDRALVQASYAVIPNQ